MAEIGVVNLSESQIEDAGRALALAFQSDPLQTYVPPDSRVRAERSPAHFAALLRYGHLFGEVFTTCVWRIVIRPLVFIVRGWRSVV